MKVAEGLAERAAIAKKAKGLRERAKVNARYLEGEQPAEDAMELLAQARELIAAEAALITRINATNSATVLDNGMSVTSALAQRDRLAQEASLLGEIAREAGPQRDPYIRGRRRTELAERTDIDVTALRAEEDRLARERRELDAEIQRSNWLTELLD